MDIPAPKQPTNHLKDRVLRFKPVAFVKKNLPVFVVIIIFILTILVGVWNIKTYTLTDDDGLEIPAEVTNQIDKYINDKLIGKNFFTFSTTTYEKEILASVPYIKEIDIEKTVPNKLEIFVKLYQPSNTAYLREKDCYVVSNEGYVLKQICQEDIANCCKKYANDNKIYIFSSSDTDISAASNGKQELLIMGQLSNIAKVINTFGYTISSVTLNSSILEVNISSGQLFRFSMADDINVQLERFIAVANRVKSDNLEFKSIDFRFERPALKK